MEDLQWKATRPRTSSTRTNDPMEVDPALPSPPLPLALPPPPPPPPAPEVQLALPPEPIPAEPLAMVVMDVRRPEFFELPIKKRISSIYAAEERNEFQCRICGRIYDTPRSRSAHMAHHTRGRLLPHRQEDEVEEEKKP